MKPLRRIHVEPALSEGLADLEVLARNLHTTWDRSAQEVLRSIDPERWETVGHNPVRLLNEVGSERLAALADDPGFHERLAGARGRLEAHLQGPRWYEGLDGAPAAIAYFSPEFGVSEILQQYSGGLGVLAGDHLKASSDLGVPLVGVGLFYRFGY